MGTGTDGGQQGRQQGRRRRRGGRPLQRKQRDRPPLHLLPSPSPVGRTRHRSMPRVSPLAPVGTADPPPPERRTTCPSLSLPRRLLSACSTRGRLLAGGWPSGIIAPVQLSGMPPSSRASYNLRPSRSALLPSSFKFITVSALPPACANESLILTIVPMFTARILVSIF
jgi:hypothetical protein